MLLGRERELALLRGQLERGGPVVVVGEAGVGKTSLVRAAAAGLGRELFEGGGFATLTWMPLLPLARAIGRELGEGDVAYVARVVEQAVGDGVLLVDDFHWVDAETRQAVLALASRLAVVAAVRRGDAGASAALEALRDFARIDLEPLDADAAAALARSRRRLSSHAVSRIVQLSGGNPLLIEELAAAGGATDSLRLSVSAHLRGLSEAGRESFLRLALLGRPAAADLLGNGVDEIVSAGLGVRSDHLVAPRHALLAETAASSLDEHERRRLHSALAIAVEDPGEAARHHLAAGERAAALEKATAAARASTRPGERAQHLRVAAEAADEGAAALRLEAATALHDARELAAAEQLLGDLKLEDPESMAHVYYLRAAIAVERADAAAAREAVREGLALVGAESAAEVRLLHAAAQIAFWLENDFEEARRLAREAYEAGRARGVDEPRLLGMLGATLAAGPDADPDAAERTLADAVVLARQADDPLTELKAGYNWFLIGAQANYDWERCRTMAQSLLERARELHLASFEQAFRVMLGRIDYHPGEYADAVDNLEPLLEEALHPQQLWLARVWLTLSLIELGELERAAAQVAALAGDPPVRTVKKITIAWLQSELELASGRPRQAKAAAERALAHPDATGSGWGIRAAVVRAWAAWELGLDPATEAQAATPRLPDARASFVELEALRLLWNGEHDAAAGTFERAARIWRQADKRAELRCLLGRAESLRAGGDLAAARELLEQVEAEAAARSMAGLTAQTRRALRLAGARRTARRVTRGVLTEREHQILELVGSGLTNREIARRLGIAAPTVERQIKSASTKLGARTRAHAAALASER